MTCPTQEFLKSTCYCSVHTLEVKECKGELKKFVIHGGWSAVCNPTEQALCLAQNILDASFLWLDALDSFGLCNTRLQALGQLYQSHRPRNFSGDALQTATTVPPETASFSQDAMLSVEAHIASKMQVDAVFGDLQVLRGARLSLLRMFSIETLALDHRISGDVCKQLLNCVATVLPTKTEDIWSTPSLRGQFCLHLACFPLISCLTVWNQPQCVPCQMCACLSGGMINALWQQETISFWYKCSSARCCKQWRGMVKLKIALVISGPYTVSNTCHRSTVQPFTSVQTWMNSGKSKNIEKNSPQFWMLKIPYSKNSLWWKPICLMVFDLPG